MIPYCAYVLRLWSEDRADGEVAVRVALLDPQSGHRIGFASLSALVEYLETVTGLQGHEAADASAVDVTADA